jgi:hypothetical protein
MEKLNNRNILIAGAARGYENICPPCWNKAMTGQPGFFAGNLFPVLLPKWYCSVLIIRLYDETQRY